MPPEDPFRRQLDHDVFSFQEDSEPAELVFTYPFSR